VILLETPKDIAQYVGKPLGTSEWITIDQTMIDTFAALTGDDHWIHIDVERASRELPQGKTIAHGFLTLSLIPLLQRSVYRIARRGRGLNYGCNRVRFPGPTPVGSRVRLHQAVKAAEPVDGAVRITFECTIEVEGEPRPSVAAETVLQIYEE
jgi:acyl dehydratase